MKFFFIVIVVFVHTVKLVAQSNIGIGTTTPHTSALLDLQSTSKGLLIPRMTTSQRNSIGTIAKGLVVYDSTIKTFMFHDGTAWQEVINPNNNLWKKTGNNIHNQNSINVGIGIDTPLYQLHVVNNNSADGGWVEGVMIENKNISIGEAALSFRNLSIPTTRQWNIGLNQNPSLAFNYGGGFAGSSTKMVIDTLGKVGIGTISPDASALMDMTSTNKGLLIPRMTSAQRKAIASPAAGLLVFDADKQLLYMYNGDQWIPFAFSDNSLTTAVSHSIPTNEIAELGEAVDVDGIWAVIGAPALKVGDSTSNGAAYVMQKGVGGWQIVQQLLPNTLDAIGRFGNAVSISGDLIAVGAYAFDESQLSPGDDEGAVFVYKRNTTTNQWEFLQKVISSSTQDGDWYGWNVDITATNLIIGAPRDGIAASDNDDGAFYIYEWNGTNFGTELKFRHPNQAKIDDWFGNSVSIDGSYAAIGAWRRDIGSSNNRGVVYLYVKGGGTWTFQDSVLLSSSYEFGKSIDLDGNYLIVGSAFFTNETWVVNLFLRSGSQWNLISSKQSDINLFDDDYNTDITVSIAYPWVVVSASQESLPIPYTGVVYVYEIVANVLQERKKIYDYAEYLSNNGFGQSVATDGNFIFIGSSRAYAQQGGGYKGKVSIATISD